MDNKCPKCGEKLSVFYLKPECPKCGCNIMYYNMEARLEKDAEKAEREWGNLDRFLLKLTPKFIKKKREEKQNENDA